MPSNEMATQSGVSLQELFVQVAITRTRMEESEKALNIRSRELERRLDDLNHAHKEAERVQRTYVTRELHDQLYQEMLARLDVLSKIQNGYATHAEFVRLKEQVDKVAESVSAMSTKNATLAAVFAAAIALANLGFLVWHSLSGGSVP